MQKFTEDLQLKVNQEGLQSIANQVRIRKNQVNFDIFNLLGIFKKLPLDQQNNDLTRVYDNEHVLKIVNEQEYELKYLQNMRWQGLTELIFVRFIQVIISNISTVIFLSYIFYYFFNEGLLSM